MTQYRVVGETNVYGHKPGSTFEMEMPAEQEWALMEGGAIRPIRPREAKAAPAEPAAEPAVTRHETEA